MFVVHATLLGTMEVSAGMRGDLSPVRLPLRRARKLLSYLLVSPRRQVDRGALCRALWPDAADAIGASLHPTVSVLRKALGAAGGAVTAASSATAHGPRFVLLRNDSIRLDPDVEWRTDLASLEASMALGRVRLEAGDEERALTIWEGVWRRFRGDLLAGWDDPWIEDRRQEWRHKRHTVLRGLYDLYLKNGRFQEAVDTRRSVLADEPLSEPDHRALFAPLAALGRRDLLRLQYERMARLLFEELDVQPMAETTAEYQHLMTMKPGPRA